MTEAEAPVIVGTNIIFSALLHAQSRILYALLTSRRRLLICETVFVELFQHQERIRRYSRSGDDELAKMLHDVLLRVEMYKEAWVSDEHVAQAMELCEGIDPADALVVSVTLASGGLLWTGDRTCDAD